MRGIWGHAEFPALLNRGRINSSYAFTTMTSASDSEPSKLTALVGPLLAAIPHVGGVLSAAWSEWDTRRRFCRIEEMLSLIRQKLSRLDINEDAADDAGMHLLELVLREAQLQHEHLKRERLANVLVNAWVSASPLKFVFDESLLFLRATTLFGDFHIAVLNHLHEAGVTGSVPFTELARLVSDPSNSDAGRNEATLIVLNDLCSGFGLAKRAWDLNKPDVKSAVLATGNLSPEGIARNCFHAITERGVRYIDFVIRGRA